MLSTYLKRANSCTLGRFVTGITAILLIYHPAGAQQPTVGAISSGGRSMLTDVVRSTTSASESQLTETRVCLAKIITAGPDQNRQMTIAVSPDESSNFQERGFAPTTCPKLQTVTIASDQRKCAASSLRDVAISLFLWRAYSLTAREMCKIVSISTQN